MEDQIPGVESDTPPLDPTQINIRSVDIRLSEIISLMAKKGITPKPSIEWSPEQQSSIIESILVRIPLQALYVDCLDDKKWTIIDGNNIMDAIKNFVEGNLVLSALEFRTDLNAKRYSELNRQDQRRIAECCITLHQIMPGVPDDIKASIERRIKFEGE